MPQIAALVEGIVFKYSQSWREHDPLQPSFHERLIPKVLLFSALLLAIQPLVCEVEGAMLYFSDSAGKGERSGTFRSSNNECEVSVKRHFGRDRCYNETALLLSLAQERVLRDWLSLVSYGFRGYAPHTNCRLICAFVARASDAPFARSGSRPHFQVSSFLRLVRDLLSSDC